MSKRNIYTNTNGVVCHVGDCFIWAEIYYLDSLTDYRECLPSEVRNSQPEFGELLFLDDTIPSSLSVLLHNIANRAVLIVRMIDRIARRCFRTSK